jgi:hypothetical protein
MWRPVIAGILGLVAALPAQHQSPDTLFIAQARLALIREADQPGLEGLLEAAEALATTLTDEDRQALAEAAHERLGEPPTAQVNDLLREHALVLDDAARAAAHTPFDPYPMAASFASSITSHGELRVIEGRGDRFTPSDLCSLLLADAQRAAAAGDFGEATERVVQALRLAGTLTAHLDDPNLWGLQVQSLIESLRLVGELAVEGELDVEVLATLSDEIVALDLDDRTVTEVIQEIVESRKRVIRQAEVDLGMRNRLRISLRDMGAVAQMEEVELDLFRGSESIDEEIDRLVETLDEPASEWEPAIRVYEGQPTFRQGLVQVAVLLNIARARASIALSLIGLSEEGSSPDLDDPFADGSVQVTETRVYSVGPDGVDESGMVAHQLNESRRLFTGGDIITMR